MVRTSPSSARGADSICGRGAKRPHATQPKNQKAWNRSNIVTNSMKTLENDPHQKKKSFKKKHFFKKKKNS